MNKNNLVLIGVGAIILLGLVFFLNRSQEPASDVVGNPNNSENTDNQNVDNTGNQVEESVETSVVVATGSYEVSATESIVNWEGRKPKIVGYKDVGTLMVKSGNFRVLNGVLFGGEVILDMSTLTTTSVSKGGTDGLTKHLQSEDFFDVVNFPEATIKVLSAQPSLASSGTPGMYDLEIEITIKGIANVVMLPVKMVQENDQAVISGHAELDRTLWDIRFGSGKFFDNLADNVIDDNFGVDFRFVANLKQVNFNDNSQKN